MVSHVAARATTPIPVESAQVTPIKPVETSEETDLDNDEKSQVEILPMSPMIVGNPAGAEFCSMSIANFRKHRTIHPIEGETTVGNQPAWEAANLRQWALYRSENRRNRNNKKKEA
jgi:hypothetical protein